MSNGNTDWRSRSQPQGFVKKDITAEDTFSDPMFCRVRFNFSLYGTWSATVHLQRSFDSSNWLDVESFTENIEKYGVEPEGAFYRFGVKSGNYSSGTVQGRIGS